MLNISYKEVTKKYDNNEEYNAGNIIVNGIQDEDSYCSTYSKEKMDYASLENEEVIDILLESSYGDVGKQLHRFNFSSDFDFWEESIKIDIFCNNYYNHKFPAIVLDMQLSDWANWNKPWSISNVAKTLEKIIGDFGQKQLEYWQDDPDGVLNGFGINYFPDNPTATIKTDLDVLMERLDAITKEVQKQLVESLNAESIITYFNFPNGIKTAGQQYLIYFAQFLADMGIDADTEIKDEVNQTLFKITPKDKNESLEKIKDALQIYLNAPNQSNFVMEIANQNDIAIKQWEANIYFLKTQLSLAQSILQAKDATIESLQLSNYQYKQLLDTQRNKDKDTEEVIEGVVAVKKYDGKWFTINIPELLRKLKRKLD